MRDLFRDLSYGTDVKAVVIEGSGDNFSSGGDVHEIIGPLVEMNMVDLMRFTRMTGDVVKAMRACPQIVIAAVELEEEKMVVLGQVANGYSVEDLSIGMSVEVDTGILYEDSEHCYLTWMWRPLPEGPNKDKK